MALAIINRMIPKVFLFLHKHVRATSCSLAKAVHSLCHHQPLRQVKQLLMVGLHGAGAVAGGAAAAAV